jgi:hypothetical protein
MNIQQGDRLIRQDYAIALPPDTMETIIMQLIQATVKGQPRQVTTKYGDRIVMDCLTYDGQEIAVWRNGDDTEILGRRNGERVTLALDAKGKYHLMESLSTELVDPTVKTNGNGNGHELGDSSRKAEIADYIQRLAKLYSYTFKIVKEQMGDSGLPIECVKDISTSVFIATTRHFDL